MPRVLRRCCLPDMRASFYSAAAAGSAALGEREGPQLVRARGVEVRPEIAATLELVLLRLVSADCLIDVVDRVRAGRDLLADLFLVPGSRNTSRLARSTSSASSWNFGVVMGSCRFRFSVSRICRRVSRSRFERPASLRFF